MGDEPSTPDASGGNGSADLAITRPRDGTADRVERIESMMLGGEWHAGSSHRMLAEEWGVGRSTVERLAAEAGRRIRRAIDPEAVTGAILAGVDAVIDKAFARKSVTVSGREYANPDLKAAIAALELRAKLLGLITHKVDAKVEDHSRLSDAELRERIFARLGEKTP